MIRSIALSEIMTTKLITLHPKDKLRRVKEIFDEFVIHHIPIVVSGNIVGIISKSDFLYISSISTNSYDKFIEDKFLNGRTVDEFMTSEIFALTPSNSIGDAIEIFMENRLSCLPIVRGSQIVGMVTPYDILKRVNKDV